MTLFEKKKKKNYQNLGIIEQIHKRKDFKLGTKNIEKESSTTY